MWISPRQTSRSVGGVKLTRWSRNFAGQSSWLWTLRKVQQKMLKMLKKMLNFGSPATTFILLGRAGEDSTYFSTFSTFFVELSIFSSKNGGPHWDTFLIRPLKLAWHPPKVQHFFEISNISAFSTFQHFLGKCWILEKLWILENVDFLGNVEFYCAYGIAGPSWRDFHAAFATTPTFLDGVWYRDRSSTKNVEYVEENVEKERGTGNISWRIHMLIDIVTWHNLITLTTHGFYEELTSCVSFLLSTWSFSDLYCVS